MQRFCILLLVTRQYVIGAAYGRSRILPKSKKLHRRPSQLEKTSKAKNASGGTPSEIEKTSSTEGAGEAGILESEKDGPSRV